MQCPGHILFRKSFHPTPWPTLLPPRLLEGQGQTAPPLWDHVPFLRVPRDRDSALGTNWVPWSRLTRWVHAAGRAPEPLVGTRPSRPCRSSSAGSWQGAGGRCRAGDTPARGQLLHIWSPGSPSGTYRPGAGCRSPCSGMAGRRQLGGHRQEVSRTRGSQQQRVERFVCYLSALFRSGV